MEKQVFNTTQQSSDIVADETIKHKKIFESDDIQPDPEALNALSLEGEVLDKFEQIVQPKPKWWKKLLGASVLLFTSAVVAQTIQWLMESWQQNQWIYFAVAIASLAVIMVAIYAIIQEWRTLVRLKRVMRQRQTSEQLWLASQSTQDDSEKGKDFCLAIAKNMRLDLQDPRFIQWQQQVSEAHSAQEVAYLFSQNVLADLDQQAKKVISKSAVEATLIVAVSPLALVDMCFVAWRNLRLINKIARIYGIELGYFSRIRLLRMVLINIAFAGATELVHEIGMDWLSQDITAKLSARVAQGIGVGLLTARLGIKTMEFCRPLSFQTGEKPRLSMIHKQLLTTLRDTVLTKNKTNKQQPEYRNSL